jgi:hypothetical protein
MDEIAKILILGKSLELVVGWRIYLEGIWAQKQLQRFLQQYKIPGLI